MKLEIITHIRPWGSTSMYVRNMCYEMLPTYNEAGPFGLPPMPINMEVIQRNCNTICDYAEKKFRVGMMISSTFRVERVGQEVQIWHVRDEKEDRIFLTLKPLQE